MTDERKHTPLPWIVETDPANDTWHKDTSIYSEETMTRVADACLLTAEAKANAAFIVECCNNYDRIKEERGRAVELLRKAYAIKGRWIPLAEESFDDTEATNSIWGLHDTIANFLASLEKKEKE